MTFDDKIRGMIGPKLAITIFLFASLFVSVLIGICVAGVLVLLHIIGWHEPIPWSVWMGSLLFCLFLMRDPLLEQFEKLRAKEEPREEPREETDIAAIIREAYEPLGKLIKDHPIGQHIQKIILALALQEDFTTATPRPANETPGLTKRYFFVQEMPVMFDVLARRPPKMDGPSPLTTPLIELIHEPHKFVYGIYRPILISQNTPVIGLYTKMRAVFGENLRDIPLDIKDPLYPVNSDLPVRRLLSYVKGTPFETFLQTPVPIEYANRFRHTYILGIPGAGKTQLIQHLLLHDIKSKDQPAIVVVDSQGDLIEKLSHLAIPNLKDRLILISPKEPPPAFNIFAVRGNNEQIINGAIATFEYLFEGMGVELTGRQGVIFRNLCRLMLTFPAVLGRNGTIHDMLNLTMGPIAPEYQRAIRTLPELNRRFFEEDFLDREYRENRSQVRTRLNAIAEDSAIANLFTSSSNKLDIYTELNRGSVILIDTSKGTLTEKPSARYGRFFISLILRATYERDAIPEDKRKAAYLYIDEAHEYFDKNIDNLLAQARKYRVGCTLAHQGLDQATTDLQASLIGRPATKLVSQASSADARKLAPDMRTTPDLLTHQPDLSFACFVRGVTEQAVSIQIPYGELEREPRLTTKQYEAFLETNRARLGETKQEQPRAEQPRPPPPPRHEAPGLGSPVIDLEPDDKGTYRL
jgi:hypothetical protein